MIFFRFYVHVGNGKNQGLIYLFANGAMIYFQKESMGKNLFYQVMKVHVCITLYPKMALYR